MVADEVQLHKISVNRQVQRQGIGRRLLQAMTERAIASGLSLATLEVRSTNQAAIKLYETFGYQVTAVRKGYYGGTGEDALIMSAELRPVIH
jgi:ribosomal-protein-alanine N-acetyltransferase